MDNNYIIDRNILGILLNLTQEEAIDSAYEDYLNRVNVVVEEAISNHLKSKDLSEEQIAVLKKRLLGNIVNDKSPEEVLDGEVDNELQKEMSEDLKNKITSLIRELNKFIYESYMKKLGEDDKKKLDDYIKEMKSTMNTVVEFMKTYVETFGQSENNALTPQINLTPPVSK